MIKDVIQYLKEEQTNNRNEYDSLLLVEEAYNSGNMEQVVNYFIDKFNSSFRSILDFCMQKGIVPDLSSEKEEQFIDLFSQSILKNKIKENIINFGESPRSGVPKISSFDDMVLVRRCDFLPENDTVVPSINFLKQEISDKILIDGQVRECKYDIPGGNNTVHFCMNQVVKPHPDAPRGWIDSKYTILQPMTEEFYKSAISFEPMDTFFVGTTKLDNYIVICDSLEAAKELLIKNKKATPIIVGKGKVSDFGTEIINCMGITCPYIDHDGKWHDYNVPMEEYYTNDFINNYPRFISERVNATGHPLHNFSGEIRSISSIVEKSKKILQLSGNSRSFEEILKMVTENMEENKAFYPLKIDALRKYNITCSSLLPSDYRDLGTILDYFYLDENFENEKIDIQAVFEKMCEGLVINETNINQFKKIKENVINMINSYEFSKKLIYADLENNLMALKVKLLSLATIMRTDAMKLPVKETEIYDVPIEWYDLSNVEEQKKNQFDQSLQSGKTFLTAAGDLIQNSPIIVPNFPLQKPQSTTFTRAKELSQLECIFDRTCINPFIDGQHVSKNNIEDINRMVSFVTVFENDRINELYDSTSKHR